MSERPIVSVAAEIEEARQQFENWRCERKRGERIPANLWAMAVELAKQHGVWPAAKALKLDHSRLKRHVGNDEDEEKNGAFVELLPQGAMVYSCTVEMEDGRGAGMRVELKGAAADVTALSRTFGASVDDRRHRANSDLGCTRACGFSLRYRWSGEDMPDGFKVGSIFWSVIRFPELEIEVDKNSELPDLKRNIHTTT